MKKIDGAKFDLQRAWFDAYNIPQPEAECRFHPQRKWRFDYCWPKQKIALEIEGGHWKIGRHQRPYGFQEDCIKYSWAAVLGWTVIRATTDMLKSGDAVVLLKAAFSEAGPKTRLPEAAPEHDLPRLSDTLRSALRTSRRLRKTS